MGKWVDSKLVEHGCGAVGAALGLIALVLSIITAGYLFHIGWDWAG